MRKIISVVVFLLYLNVSFAIDYSKVDNQSATVPGNPKTVEEITSSLTKNLTSPTEKARAIYYWISHNISYNFQYYTSNQSLASTDELLAETLKSHQGVCANYSELFKACCKAVDIESIVINGYTKTDGKIADISHAWNAIKINEKYYLVDATWAAGHDEKGKYIQYFDDRYFMISPEEFIKTHMPFDLIWQFLDNPLTNKEFEASDFSKLNKPGNFNFSDSIKIQSSLSPLEKLVRENKRISNSGLTNKLIRNRMAYNQLNITNERYNLTVELFNKSVQIFNTYILAKNKQFDGLKMPDDQIIELLSTATAKLNEAQKINTFLNSDNPDLNKLVDQMGISIKELRTNLETEDAFMKKYLKKWKPLRVFMFYR
ncbi:MAG: transglutaminase domain-containing protein [Paludibacter sp.]|nr:transglutaminase domain-containing protein [Paludibacter sp.]